VATTAANETHGAENDSYVVPWTTSPSTYTYTLRATSPVPPTGHRIRFTRRDFDHLNIGKIVFKTGSVTIAEFPTGGGGSGEFACWVEFEFGGADWFVSAWGGGTNADFNDV
jgi:hypothetical protein